MITVCLVLVALPASANDGAPPEAPLEFGYFADNSFEEIYSSMLDANARGDVADFLAAHLASADRGMDLPGVEGLSPEERTLALLVTKSAARSGDSSVLERLPLKARRSVWDVAPLSIESAQVAGHAANNRRSWQYENRYNWTECGTPLSCKTVAWLDMRFTTDPGRTGTRTTVNITRWGTKLSKLAMTSSVYANTTRVHTNGPTTWNPGHGFQWNTPHASTDGKTFQAYYYITIPNPRGQAILEYKTKRTGSCGDPNGGGYRCLF